MNRIDLRRDIPMFSLLALAALALGGCAQAGALFYLNQHTQAIERDTIRPDGTTQTFVQNPQDAAYGTIRLAPVEMLDLQEVPLEVPAGELPGPFNQPRTLKVPPGFRASLFAFGIGHPGDLALREDGTLFFSNTDAGEVVALQPTGERTVIASGLRYPFGLEMHNGALYYTDETHVYRFDFSSPTAVTGNTTLLSDRLPKGGTFFTRTIRWVPNEKRFYISVGAVSNKSIPDNPETATILRMPEGGGKLDVAMRGLRNTMGMDVAPSGELWGVDQGTDWLAVDLPPDEVNILRVGRQYGWPYYYSKNFRDPEYMEADTIRYPKNPEPSTIDLQAHSGITDMTFYRSSALGPDWTNSALLAYHGGGGTARLIARIPPTGFKIVRLRAGTDGSNPRQADIVTGFYTELGGTWGHPTAIAISSDGRTFYVSDDVSGAIYRFTSQ